ncbi:MAG: alpha-ribazole phosphatase [Leptospiraceae bacterium]|nr:alpha-ribazole phosphatase [Leptospiraceae bacterium]
MEIYLIRHTKVDVPSNTCYGQSDVSLADSFVQETQSILEKLPNTEHFICYTSPLTRCKSLAGKIRVREIKMEPRLMELNFGDWELKTWKNIGKESFDLWHEDFVNNKVPGGESYFELYTRVKSFWKEMISKKEDTILITHGGVIHALLAHSLGLALENSFRLKIDYGSITKIILNGEFVNVEYVNR